VLVDTNVLVSAALRGCKPRELLDAAEEGGCTLILSVHILSELAAVLARPILAVTEDEAAALIEALVAIAEVMPVEGAPEGECRDRDHEPVLVAALVGKADFIVAGDKDLLSVERPPVPVLTVAEALRRL
jgi:putative PIN family toxin of toxin-antitoxin system